MTLLENISLKQYNTFGISATCQYFADIVSPLDLQILLQSGLLQHFPFFILGGGSNVVFRSHFAGIVVRMATKGILVEEETEDTVLVKAAAGELWSDFVNYCVLHGWYGVENLTAIPGTVGASPVQNVGAYGVEAKDVIESVEVREILTGQQHVFQNSDCRFGYRSSVFKQEFRNQYIVSSVTFRLKKAADYHLDYGAIQSELAKEGIHALTLQDISRVISRVREEKLPDPARIGSAGSFFKNPVIAADQYEVLSQKYPAMVAYPQGANYKIAAGWLIEQCGWKGRVVGTVGVYPKQALVLYNAGDCTGEEVEALSQAIGQSVADMFGIQLETEAIFV